MQLRQLHLHLVSLLAVLSPLLLDKRRNLILHLRNSQRRQQLVDFHLALLEQQRQGSHLVEPQELVHLLALGKIAIYFRHVAGSPRMISTTTLLLTRIHTNFSSMFGQAAAAAIQAKKDEEGANADDDEEEPPKEEIKQVVEDDAIHSVR